MRNPGASNRGRIVCPLRPWCLFASIRMARALCELAEPCPNATPGDRGRARGHERPPRSPRLVLRRLRRHGARGPAGVRSLGQPTASPTPFHANTSTGTRRHPRPARGWRRTCARPRLRLGPHPARVHPGWGGGLAQAGRRGPRIPHRPRRRAVILCRNERRGLLSYRYPNGSGAENGPFFPSRK